MYSTLEVSITGEILARWHFLNFRLDPQGHSSFRGKLSQGFMEKPGLILKPWFAVLSTSGY